MNKYHIKIEYDGSNFVGWQYQNNGISVQEVLQKAFFYPGKGNQSFFLR